MYDAISVRLICFNDDWLCYVLPISISKMSTSAKIFTGLDVNIVERGYLCLLHGKFSNMIWLFKVSL